MNVRDLVCAMESLAPSRHACDWDNVGLLVGDPEAPLTSVLLAIDSTDAVFREAKASGVSALVAYHPLIFSGQKRFVAGAPGYCFARANIAVYSPHTALDVAPGGTNDVLADALGMTTREALKSLEAIEPTLKIVTFVPQGSLEAVCDALFLAGAGRLGKYRSCSFRTEGTGTFHGDEGTTPAVGISGRLERVSEVRVEMVLPEAAASAVVRALRNAHPYEEPAFDLLRLLSNERHVGMGRVGAVAPGRAWTHAERIKVALGARHVLVAGPMDRAVVRAAVCAGSGGDLLEDAIAAGAELFVTGELRHHDVLRAADAGVAVICTLHSVSERAALSAMKERLEAQLDGVLVRCSTADREPLSVF